MPYICPLCKILPSSHSLTKVLEKKGVIYYYTCPSQAKLYFELYNIFRKLLRIIKIIIYNRCYK